MQRHLILAATISVLVPASGTIAAEADDVHVDPEGNAPIRTIEWDGTRPVPFTMLGELGLVTDAGAKGGSGAGGDTEGGAQDSISVEQDPEGDMPREIRWLPDGSAYVVIHRDTDLLTVHDAASGDVSASFVVGDFPVDVALSPDSATAVTANVLGNSLSIVDLDSGTVTDVPVTGLQPYRVLITPDGSRAAAGVINDGVSSAVSVVDLATATEVASIATGGQGAIGVQFNVESAEFKNFFTDLAMNGDGRLVTYDRANDVATVVDVLAGTVVNIVDLPDGPDSVAVQPGGTLAAIGCETADELAVIDLSTATLVTTFPAPGLGDRRLLITPNGQEIVGWTTTFVTFFDISSGAILGGVDHANFVKGDLEFTGDGANLLVGSARLRVIDLATRTLVETVEAPPTYETAASPTGDTVVALNNIFSSDIHTFTINDAASTFDGNRAAGVPAEGDNPFTVDVSPDGNTAIAGNLWSGNLAVIDLPAGTVRAWIPCGFRIKEARISPDGMTAAVCAMDANQVVFIDLATDTVRGAIPIFNRPAHVEFSPDSSEAYVLNIAGTDRLSFIDLSSPVPALITQIGAGQAGAANGPTYSEVSGMAITADGAYVLTCDSFNDLLRVYDTAARSLVASVPTGDFPLQVGVAANASIAVVVNHFGDSVTVVNIDGASSSAIGDVVGLDRFPISVAVDGPGNFAYVGTRPSGGTGTNALRSIDLNTLSVAMTLDLGDGSPRDLVADFDGASGGELIAGLTNSELLVIDVLGGALTPIDLYTLPATPKELAFDAGSRNVLAAMPPVDAIERVDLPGGAPPCPADLDGSGAVDFADILEVLSNFGGVGPDGDANADGTVNFADLLAVLSEFGPCP
ncbi:MAG: beta-propeller fold lactonase family protein [Phycisphaerales bacterium]